MPDRRHTIRALTILLLLVSTAAQAAEISAPITWQARGWMYRYIPVDERFFLDGGIVASVDAVAMDGESLDGYFYVGAGLTVTMGWKENGLVIFDPRDAHYSLIGGFRFEVSRWMANIEYLHDCFHDVDRYDERTEIWNVAKLDFYNRDWYPRYRRQTWSQKSGRRLLFDYAYYATTWFFPRWGSNEWIQHDHDFSFAVGGGLKLALAHWKNNAFELRPNLLYFLDRGGEWTHRNSALGYLTHYGRDGTAALFAGPQWDSQRIKPSGDRWIVGLDFYF